jgi:predicted PurR-regulated permease PerM
MTTIISFISTHSVELSVALVFILALLYFVFLAKDKKVQLAKIALYFVAWAEKEYGGKTGEIKYAAVVAQLYKYIPTVLRPFISAAFISEAIETAVKKLKDVLERGATLDSYFVENYLEGVDPGSPTAK